MGGDEKMGYWMERWIPNSDQTQDPAVRERYGVVSGGVGICLNLLLFCGKALAGVITSSIAITADAFNNLSDAGSSVVTLVGFRLAGRRADASHPFGHGRMEYLAGLVVSMAIVLVGAELGRTSLGKILHPQATEFSWLSVGILAAAVCVKLWMYWFNRRLGHRLDSAAMMATAAPAPITTGCVARVCRRSTEAITMWSTTGADTACRPRHVAITGFRTAMTTCWWPSPRA